MNTPIVLPKKSRSESAKKMWERRKANKEAPMTNPSMKAWVYHTEWVTLMVMVLGCFVFVFHETVHTNERLDNHMEAINRRTDEISRDSNRRCDELHKEFYDLLKEMKKS